MYCGNDKNLVECENVSYIVTGLFLNGVLLASVVSDVSVKERKPIELYWKLKPLQLAKASTALCLAFLVCLLSQCLLWSNV